VRHGHDLAAALEARTNRLARAYREVGVRPDSFVTIGLPKSIDHSA
jgi:bile acid-coenzyme A ligase